MNLLPWKASSLLPYPRTRVSDELSSFQREMNSLMNSFFGRSDAFTPAALDASYCPSIDLREKGGKYILDAEVPGMNESELDVDLHDNILTIKGEKKSEKETSDIDYVCVERSSGSFRRDIYLSDEVDPTNVKAALKDGVLHVELTKKEPSKTTRKKIAIGH